MNFFKSIILDDPEPPKPESPRESGPDSADNPPDEDRDSNGADQGGDADGWSFGSLIKTLATRSESVIEAYRRDLQEFGSGLKKETEMLRETASRAVKDLPASLEAAQGAIDVVLKSTASIINKEALGFSSDGESETPGTNRSLNSGRYSRFEAQLSTLQSDLNTFCVEPEDAEDYGKWKLGFELGDYEDAIDGLIEENGIVEGVYRRAVPNAVDQETFWCRYFYRVDKLKQQESVRASIVKRAISNDDEEELSWDVDDDDGSGSDRVGGNVASDGKSKAAGDRPVGNTEAVDGGKGNVVELSEKSSVDEREGKSGTVDEVERDEKVKCEDGNDEKGECGDKSDASVVVSSQQVAEEEEEDLGWDEIGDVGSGDEKKTSAAGGGGNQNKDDLRKRLAVKDDDDDLNWDIEDDDEPVKA